MLVGYKRPERAYCLCYTGSNDSYLRRIYDRWTGRCKCSSRKISHWDSENSQVSKWISIVLGKFSAFSLLHTIETTVLVLILQVIPVILQTLDPAKYQSESRRVILRCLTLLHQVDYSPMKELIPRVLDFVLFIASDFAGDIKGRGKDIVFLQSEWTCFSCRYFRSAVWPYLNRGCLRKPEARLS